MEVNGLNKEYHTLDGKFREQIAVLYLGQVNEEEGTVTLVRSYRNICLSGAASFDPEKPGADTLKAWQVIDDMIENEGVVGVFHTHPAGVHDFSEHDVMTMKGMAKSNGSRLLWYGVQAADMPVAHFVCMNMNAGQVFSFDYGRIKSSPDELVITLPLPIRVTNQDGIFVIES